MTEEDPLKSSPEDKEAAMERMRTLLAKRLMEGEVLPMGFTEGPMPGNQVRGDHPIAMEPARASNGGRRRPTRKGSPSGSMSEGKASTSIDYVDGGFEWVRRSMRVHPVQMLAFDAYCNAKRRRHCDVLAQILGDFIESEEFRSVVRIQKDEGK